jgi:hypothetical protein
VVSRKLGAEGTKRNSPLNREKSGQIFFSLVKKNLARLTEVLSSPIHESKGLNHSELSISTASCTT